MEELRKVLKELIARSYGTKYKHEDAIKEVDKYEKEISSIMVSREAVEKAIDEESWGITIPDVGKLKFRLREIK